MHICVALYYIQQTLVLQGEEQRRTELVTDVEDRFSNSSRLAYRIARFVVKDISKAAYGRSLDRQLYTSYARFARPAAV